MRDSDLSCPICQSDLLDHFDGNTEAATMYPNLVCPDCNDRAVTADGKPADDWNEYKDNIPVYIDGKQCWRRYRFGSAAMYDPYNCATLEEFHRRIFPA